jgi:hypothetical protein
VWDDEEFSESVSRGWLFLDILKVNC